MHISLTHDCTNCAALCCVALAFDQGDRFAFDKPAGTACPNLGADYRCRIHKRLNDQGCSGCVAYTCHGAGQRTVAALTDTDWQQKPDALPALMEMFADLRKVQDRLQILSAAQALPLGNLQSELDALIAQYGADVDTARAALGGPWDDRYRAFLLALRPIARPRTGT